MDYTTAKRTFKSLISKEENPDTKQLLKESFYSWVKEYHPLEYQLHQIKKESGIPKGATVVRTSRVILAEHRRAAFSTGSPLEELKAFNLITLSHPDWKRTYVEDGLEFATDTVDKWEYPEAVNAYTQLILNYQTDSSLAG
jgi:hypothetical protein